MTLVFVSFFAGILTTFAPCILPLLPIIIGGGIARKESKQAWKRGLVVVISLAASVIIFTLILKASTALLGIPQELWRLFAGSIVIVLGISYLFPSLWQALSLRIGLGTLGNISLAKASSKDGLIGAILTGAALGPVFTSCSPTYALIVAAVLPASFTAGLVYLTAYALGMALVLLLVILLGNIIIKRLGWALNEHSIFNKVIGTLFIIVGIAVVGGLDKHAQTWLLERGVYDGTSGFEQLIEY